MSHISLAKTTKFEPKKDFIFLAENVTELKGLGLSKLELDHVKAQLQNDQGQAYCERAGLVMLIVVIKEKDQSKRWENARLAGATFVGKLNGLKRKQVVISGAAKDPDVLLALAEGMSLANYDFKPYKSNKPNGPTMRKVSIHHKDIAAKQLKELEQVCGSVNWARDLVNKPLSHLTATDLAKEIKSMGKDAGFKVDVLNKAKIKSLKMGGLLAVNAGSPDPPTFSILEWKPKKAINKKPILLVGKGVVYDTGGLSLKPTPNSMDIMKSDMGGAACIAATIHAVAKQQLPVHVVGLIPATDNRPGGNAYVPGDVITMHDGQTVEVLNTDAEGRMILADAHSYGKRYKPELVIDAATLTGAAVRAIGLNGVVTMGTASEKHFQALAEAGDHVYERTVQMPFWEEFDRDIDSDIADMKNLGGPYADHITAGKFLARFVKDPYIHIDIAGPAYIPSKSGYRPKGGTGVGVRLLYRFLRNYSLG